MAAKRKPKKRASAAMNAATTWCGPRLRVFRADGFEGLRTRSVRGTLPAVNIATLHYYFSDQGGADRRGHGPSLPRGSSPCHAPKKPSITGSPGARPSATGISPMRRFYRAKYPDPGGGS